MYLDSSIFFKINNDQELFFVIIRAFILFIGLIFFIRFGNRRFQLNTAFDYLLLIILGSLISRGINGKASLVSTLVASASLVFLHKLIAVITYYNQSMELLFKGRACIIVKNGNYIKENLEKFHITEEDILRQMRLELHVDDIALIKLAYLENSGKISFVR